MPPIEEDEQGVLEEDDELDDSEGDDSDMEDDLDDEEGEFPDSSPPGPPAHSQPFILSKEEPNSHTAFLNPNPNHAVGPAPTFPRNGSIAAVSITAGEAFTSPSSHIASSAAEDSRRAATAASSLDDSRRLFQRLWTDDDEITILQGFLEFTTQRGTTHASHQYDTGPFYEQIKKQLQLEFSKNQLIEKLRRLKKKYRNVVNRMVSGKDFSFKSAHEQATFEISRKIWSASIKRSSRDSEDDEFMLNPAGSTFMEFDSGFGMSDGTHHPILGSERRLSKSRRRIRAAAEQGAAAASTATCTALILRESPLPNPKSREGQDCFGAFNKIAEEGREGREAISQRKTNKQEGGEGESDRGRATKGKVSKDGPVVWIEADCSL